MGACSSKRKNDEYIVAHYQQLIDDIYKNAEVCVTRRVPIKEGTSLQLKALLEFLENNQIRLPDALKEIEKRILSAPDDVPLETSLLIFIGITETINRLLTKKEIEADDEDETHMGEIEIQLDQQMLSRIIQTKQQMLTCISLMLESIHLPKIFGQFLYFFKVYANLQKIHYDPQLRKIVRFFQEIVYQYLQPHMEPGNIHSNRLPESSGSSRSPIRRFTKSAFQVHRQRETSVNRIACDLTQTNFIESLNFYVTLLEMVDSNQKHQSSLFRSETEGQIFGALLDMYGQGKFTLDPDDKDDFLQQFATPFLRLLKLIQERSRNYEDEFIENVLLKFQKEYWIHTHKIEQLLNRILALNASDPLHLAILNSLTEQTQRCLLEMRFHGGSHLDQSLQYINEMPTKQFSHYLTESGCDNSQFASISQQSVLKSRSIAFPNQSLLIVKSAIRCLFVLLQKIKFSYFQTESCIQVLMKAIVAAQQHNYLDLSLQSRQTFNYLMLNIVADIDNFLNVIYQMVAFTQMLLSSEDEQYLAYHQDHDVPEEYDSNAEKILRVTLILDMVLESLGLVGIRDRKYYVDDELIYSLIFIFERGTSAVQRRVISIITKIITNVESEYFMSVTESQVFQVSDSGAILFVVQFLEHENNSVKRGLANNNSVFVLVNVILFLGQKQPQVILSIASHLRKKLLISVDDLATRIFTLTIYSIGLLSLGIAIPQFGNVKQITKSMLNDIIHFNLEDRLKWLPKILDIDFPKPILDVDIILDRYRKRDWDTHLEEIEIRAQTSRVSPFSTKNYLSAPSMRLESQQNFEQMCQQIQRNQQRQRQIFNEDRWLL